MKLSFTILFTGISLFEIAAAQDPLLPNTNTEQQLENLTQANETETEDDSWLQQMEQFKKSPINLNLADADDLKTLKILTDLQIVHFLSYRKLLGHFISVYELQAIPTWDIVTIRKIAPFITVRNSENLFETSGKRLKGGDHTLLLRYAQVFEKAEGYTPRPTGSYYLGSPQRLYFRYRYQYKNQLQYGLLGDKDAGEQFFKGKQQYGFDFYSLHIFIRKIGLIQSIAIGDFTVNMGEGLIQWQSIAFRKGVDISSTKRQSTVLRPYNSAGEYNFHRGAGITIRKGNLEATAFGSIRKINANFNADTVNAEDFFSSFLTSGYNRTQHELDDKNSLQQFAFGGNISWTRKQLHIGFNSIQYSFSNPIQKRPEAYNLYAINGKHWNNFSIDYSYTYRNFHLFGEAAADKNFNKAIVNGLLISVDPRVDLSFIQRAIRPEYQSINGNAFTENTYPTNENGLYAGISVRPAQGFRLDAYADFYKFPWLKYLVDAPSSGKDFFLQFTYKPDKQVEVYTRYRIETKQKNRPGNMAITNQLISFPLQNWRTQFGYQLSRGILLRSRIELLWYDKKERNNEKGFLAYTDCVFKPPLKRYSGSVRVQYFETDGYNSRLYAFENDLPYNYAIPVFFDKGYRYYLNLNYDPVKQVSLWIKFAQTIYDDKSSIGSGLDLIRGNTKTEGKLQINIFL